MSLIQKSMLSAAAAVIASAARFAITVILAKRLLPADFGQFVYAQWLVDMAFLLCALGVNGVVARYLAEYAHDPVRRALVLRGWLPLAVSLPVVSGCAVMTAAWLSGLALSVTGYLLLGAWAVATGLASMQAGALYGQQRFDLIVKSSVAFALVAIPAALFVPLHGASIDAFLAALTLASLCSAAFGVRATARLLACEGAGGVVMPWGKIRAYAVNVWITALLWAFVWSRGEIPILRAHLGDGGVARYTAALSIFLGAIQLTMLWVSGVAPHLSALWGSGDRAGAVATARRLSDVQLLVSVCAAVLLNVVGYELIGFVFGAAYQPSASSLAVLSLGLITLSASVQNHLLQLTTDARFNRNASIFGLIVLFAVASVCIPRFGIAGAALARTSTMWCVFLVSLIFTWQAWGRRALSAANVLLALAAVGTPLVLLGSGHSPLGTRVLVSLPCLLAFVLLSRSSTNQLVAIELIGSGRRHFRARLS